MAADEFRTHAKSGPGNTAGLYVHGLKIRAGDNTFTLKPSAFWDDVSQVAVQDVSPSPAHPYGHIFKLSTAPVVITHFSNWLEANGCRCTEVLEEFDIHISGAVNKVPVELEIPEQGDTCSALLDFIYTDKLKGWMFIYAYLSKKGTGWNLWLDGDNDG